MKKTLVVIDMQNDFVHAVELERGILLGNFQEVLPHSLWVSVYAIIALFSR